MFNQRNLLLVCLLAAVLAVGCSSKAQESNESGPSTSLPTSSGGATSAVTTSLASTTAGPDTSQLSVGSYGDFSDLSPLEVDTFEATRLLVRCMNDQGFEVEVIPPGDGISYQAVPQEQNVAAQEAEERCRDGLGLREVTAADYTDEVRSHIYDYQVALRECLVGAGYEIPDPPSRDIFVESYLTDPWIPYSWVPGGDLDPYRSDSILYRCPQYPPGGILSWRSNDPIPTLQPPD